MGKFLLKLIYSATLFFVAVAFNPISSQACTVPSGFTTTSITSTGATLGWGSVSGAISYSVRYRLTGTTSWTTVTVTTNSKTLTGLSPGSSYDWKVLTTCSSGNSSYSSVMVFNTLCAIPSGLSTTSITNSSAKLNWSSTPCDSFLLRYFVTSIPGTVYFKTIQSSGTNITITGLSSGTNYSWLIRTYCNGGQSGTYTSTQTFNTLGSCGTPGGLAAGSITSSGATLSWNSVSGAVSYNIQYRKSGSSSWTSATSASTSKTISGLVAATQYEYQLQTVCSSGSSSWSASAFFTTANSSTLPVPDHVVVLIEENHGYSQIIGSSSAPYINALATDAMSASFTSMYGVEHPSQPNYLDLFSGGNQGITNNNLPASHFTTANLARELINAGKTFISYAQTLPSAGSDVATSGKYARKHNPITNWMGTGTNQISSTLNQPFTAFPTNYSTLPTVSFVIPNLDNDMHDGTIATGDTWFHNNLDAYVQWAKTHNSLFILIYDEDDGNYSNRIPMIFTGPMVKSGTVATTYNLYNVLRTLEDMYGTSHAGNAASVSAIHSCWLNGYKEAASVAESNPEINIFPNPVKDIVNITFDLDENETATLNFYNSIGEKISSMVTAQDGALHHALQLSVSSLGLSNGIYFVEMLVNEKRVFKKMLVSN